MAGRQTMLASLCAKTDEQSVKRLSWDGSMDDQKTSLPRSALTGGLHKALHFSATRRFASVKAR
jgi:hypothetical protein